MILMKFPVHRGALLLFSSIPFSFLDFLRIILPTLYGLFLLEATLSELLPVSKDTENPGMAAGIFWI